MNGPHVFSPSTVHISKLCLYEYFLSQRGLQCDTLWTAPQTTQYFHRVCRSTAARGRCDGWTRANYPLYTIWRFWSHTGEHIILNTVVVKYRMVSKWTVVCMWHVLQKHCVDRDVFFLHFQCLVMLDVHVHVSLWKLPRCVWCGKVHKDTPAQLHQMPRILNQSCRRHWHRYGHMYAAPCFLYLPHSSIWMCFMIYGLCQLL